MNGGHIIDGENFDDSSSDEDGTVSNKSAIDVNKALTLGGVPTFQHSNSSYVNMSPSELGGGLTRRMKDENSLDHSKVLSEAKHAITRICLTGGHCAGKTTAITTLTTVLRQLGFRVLLVPEAANLLTKGGAMMESSKLSFAEAVRLQIHVMKMQMALEDILIEIALAEEHPTIVICDRGVM